MYIAGFFHVRKGPHIAPAYTKISCGIREELLPSPLGSKCRSLHQESIWTFPPRSPFHQSIRLWRVTPTPPQPVRFPGSARELFLFDPLQSTLLPDSRMDKSGIKANFPFFPSSFANLRLWQWVNPVFENQLIVGELIGIVSLLLFLVYS